MSISRLRKEMTTLRKMKTLLLILLAAALLAACAALPAVAAVVQDRRMEIGEVLSEFVRQDA